MAVRDSDNVTDCSCSQITELGVGLNNQCSEDHKHYEHLTDRLASILTVPKLVLEILITCSFYVV